MKILHTSDLHLGATWFGQKRSEDERRVIGEILELCDQHRVDLLLITGDVFSDRTSQPLPQVARRFFEQLAPAMRRGLRVMLLRGNHDDLRFFQLLRYICEEWLGEHTAPPIIADLPGIYNIPGTDVQVIALPYLTPGDLQSSALDAGVDADKRMVGLSGLLAQRLQALYQKVQPNKRTIFAGHLMVKGAQITPEVEFESGYHRELWITPDTLPQFTSYNALGHIHLSQELAHVGKPTWYAGGADRQDMGERDYTPQVLLVELPERPGGAAAVTSIPLSRCTPFVEHTFESLDVVRAFCDEVQESNPLGRITLNVAYTERAECEARIREAAPRLQVKIEAQTELSRLTDDGIDPRDIVGTISNFIEQNYTDAAQKARLLAGFARLARLYEEVEL